MCSVTVGEIDGLKLASDEALIGPIPPRRVPPCCMVYIEASWIECSRLWIIILIHCYVILKTTTSSEHYYFIVSNICQNNDNIGSAFPPISGQILATSGSSHRPK